MCGPYGLKSLLLITSRSVSLPPNQRCPSRYVHHDRLLVLFRQNQPGVLGGLIPYAYCTQANNPSQQQSPIDVMPGAAYPVSVNTSLTLSTHYASTAVPVEDLGYTIEADYGTGSSQNSVTFNGVTYNLLQFHFHQVSEHTINYQVTQ